MSCRNPGFACQSEDKTNDLQKDSANIQSSLKQNRKKKHLHNKTGGSWLAQWILLNSTVKTHWFSTGLLPWQTKIGKSLARHNWTPRLGRRLATGELPWCVASEITWVLSSRLRFNPDLKSSVPASSACRCNINFPSELGFCQLSDQTNYRSSRTIQNHFCL